MRTWTTLGLLCLSFIAACSAQVAWNNNFTSSAPASYMVRGQLAADRPFDAHQYTLELVSCHDGTPPSRLAPDTTGEFVFRDVTPGCHQLHLLASPSMTVLQTRLVEVGANLAPVRMQLESRLASTAETGFVSMRQLQHPPSRRSVDLYGRALKDAEAGRFEPAIAALKRAIDLSPYFADAQELLGGVYLREGRFDDAQKAFLNALSLGLDTPVVHANLAIAKLQLGQTGAGATEAELALHRAPQNPLAHFAMAMSLLAGPRSGVAQALKHLATAAPALHVAYMVSARVRIRLGEFAAAAEDLRAFLKDCPPSRRADAERMLHDLPTQVATIKQGAY